MKLPDKIVHELTSEQYDFLNVFLKNFPDIYYSDLLFKRYAKNKTLISSGDTCPYVYILINGRLQAVEEELTAEPYRFIEISAIDIVGDYELFQNTANRIITLYAIESCTCILIPSKFYLNWIKNDANALFIRTQKLIQQISAQTQFERQNFFLDNKMRLAFFLVSEYTHNASGKPQCIINYTRLQIAQKLGCSLRTVNRTLMGFKELGLVSTVRGKICITKEQYHALKSFHDT